MPLTARVEGSPYESGSPLLTVIQLVALSSLLKIPPIVPAAAKILFPFIAKSSMLPPFGPFVFTHCACRVAN
ncbi:MAG: hypothetical protein M3R36_11870 [Bacteroidota bacterium]|nr:hypothetical protein [Bacteroidota bacterium]